MIPDTASINGIPHMVKLRDLVDCKIALLQGSGDRERASEVLEAYKSQFDGDMDHLDSVLAIQVICYLETRGIELGQSEEISMSLGCGGL